MDLPDRTSEEPSDRAEQRIGKSAVAKESDKSEDRNPKIVASKLPSSGHSSTADQTSEKSSKPINGGPSESPDDTSARPVVEIETPKTPVAAPEPAEGSSGTGVATNGQSMKFVGQMNEIAGSAVQELPPGSPLLFSTGADVSAQAAKSVLPVDFSSSKDASFQWLATDAGAKASPSATTTMGNAGGTNATAVATPAPLERMIAREVTMVRQSGAQSLAVTLKVDAHTSLFLQLTNHNGQIEASVRCDKGDAGALGGHWGQLQESLARQNVQLQPLESKLASNKWSGDTTGTTSQKDFNQRQSSQHAPSPEAILPATGANPSDDAVSAAAVMGNSPPQTHPPRGWEKWA
jgi:hypothetical protein